jgi:hypothetical protein
MRNLKWVWLCLLMLAANDVFAQPSQPFGRFVIDARGTLARFKDDPQVASSLDVTTENLPTRGLGAAVGVHWYPIRGRRVSLGVGGELVIARDSRTAEPDEDDEDDETAVEAPTVTTRFSSISPQISLNFGKRDGWSYISGGLGRARLSAERDDEPFADSADATQTFHYGGGARWFTGPHLAFSFDLRFYTINASEASGTRPSYPRTKMMVISAGISMR